MKEHIEIYLKLTQNILYSLTRPQEPFELKVRIQHKSYSYLTLNISPLNEGSWLIFELMTSYYVGSDTILRNQFKKKLKFMVDNPRDIIYQR